MTFFLLIDARHRWLESRLAKKKMYRSIETTLRSIHDNPSSAFTLTPSGFAFHPHVCSIRPVDTVMHGSIEHGNTYVALGEAEILGGREEKPPLYTRSGTLRYVDYNECNLSRAHL